ncbi:MAG: hypothetical protein P4L61_03395, partial [Candidatus Pacebacteria bacterium]|nr:hypothetical protein [Candidatus Paceibacterota bacterium]
MNTNTQKGFIVPLVITVVVVLLAGGAYLAYKNEKGQVETAAQTASQVAAQSDQASTTSAGAAMSSTTTIDNVRTNATGGLNVISTPTTAWQTYTNNQYGFNIQIPPDWIASNLSPYVSFATKAQEQSQIGKSYEMLFKQGDDSAQMTAHNATTISGVTLNGVVWSVMDDN